MKKIIVLIITIITLTTNVPYAEAIDTFTYDESLICKNEYINNDDSFSEEYIDTNNNTISIDDYSNYSKWDSRDYGLITSVKNQGDTGTCWAFATCAAAEASLIKQGYETKDTVNLSEAHLVNFLNPYVENSNISVQQDSITLPANQNPFLNGGSYEIARGAIQRGSGFTSESDYPFTNQISSMTYSADNMFECKYTIDSIQIHTSMNSIKEAIINSGAVVTEYYCDSSLVKYYGSKAPYTCTTYQNKTTNINHAVAIIGWDDAFSADNFINKPEGDGAWLCKNSWGANNTKDGYVWISYYDTSVKEACELIVKPRDYDYIYQYDGNTANGLLSLSKSKIAKIGNVYTADKTGYIKGFGFSVASGNYNCTVSLYKGNFTSKNCTLIEEVKNVISTSEGYVTGEFSTIHRIEANETFSVVVVYNNTDNDTVNRIPIEMTSKIYKPSIEKNQTFYFNGNKYVDLTKVNNCGNASIKAFVSYNNEDTVSLTISEQTTSENIIVNNPESIANTFFSADSPVFIIRFVINLFSTITKLF